MSFFYCISAVFILAIVGSALVNIQAREMCNDCTVERIYASPNSVSPVGIQWDAKSESLYYCDLSRNDSCAIMRYCCAEDRVYCATVKDVPFIMSIILIEGKSNQFVCCSNKTVNIVEWDGESPKAKRIRTVFEAENCSEYAGNVFNDAHADPYGRIFVGSTRLARCRDLNTSATYGNLFQISAHKPPVTAIKPKTIRLTNGMTFDAQRNKFYYLDGCSWNIQSFDYCPYTGDLSNPKVIYNYTDGSQSTTSFLKSIIVDRKGDLYVSTQGSGEIIKICPRTGKEICRISFPCPQVTGMAFAGKYLDELYVATASNPRLQPQDPSCGYLYKVQGIRVGGLNPDRARF